MGFADGFYYGQGRIICDTSTFSVGDTIRVRSMTDSNKVWNQQVATVGTALVFTVPCYDYYKICTVQDIGGVATEVGGTYRTIDYGQTLFINVLDKTTLGGIQGILNAHQELNVLSIGDEVTIKIYDGGITPIDWTMQIGALDLYDSHEVIFVSKNILDITAVNAGGNGSYANTNDLKARMELFYDSMVDNDKVLLKETTKSSLKSNTTSYETFSAKVFPPNYKEVGGSNLPWGTSPVTQYQYPIFTTQANRIKTYNGTGTSWWTCDGGGGSTGANIEWSYVGTSGAVGYQGFYSNNTSGVLPCFRLTADS